MDDRGLGLIEILLLITFLAVIFAFMFPAKASGKQISMHFTCYCPESCPGTTTYTGATLREGIAAVTEEHIGDCALIYTVSGDFIGYYECLDKIGTGRNDVIDVWKPDIESARELIKHTDARVMVEFVRRPGG